MHNSSSNHALAAFIGEASAAAWRAVWGARPRQRRRRRGGDGRRRREWSRDVRSLEPPTAADGAELEIKLILSLFAALFVLVPFCYIPAAATAVFVVKERAVKAKHLQLVSGASASAYWAATFLWDFIMYVLMHTGAVMAVFAAYGEPAFVGSTAQAAAVALLLVAYGAASLPLVYCYSYLFEGHSTAQVSIMIFNIVAGFVAVIAHLIMQYLDDEPVREADRSWSRSTACCLVPLRRRAAPARARMARPPRNWRILAQAPIILLLLYRYENDLLQTPDANDPWQWEVTGARSRTSAPSSCLLWLLLALDTHSPSSPPSAERAAPPPSAASTSPRSRCRGRRESSSPSLRSPSCCSRRRAAAIAAAAVPAAAAAIGGVVGAATRRTASTGAAKAPGCRRRPRRTGYAEEEDAAAERAVAEAMVVPAAGPAAASEAPAVLISKLGGPPAGEGEGGRRRLVTHRPQGRVLRLLGRQRR